MKKDYKLDLGLGGMVTVSPRVSLVKQDAGSTVGEGLAVALINVATGNVFADLTVNREEYIGIKNCAYIDHRMAKYLPQLEAQGMFAMIGVPKVIGGYYYQLAIFNEDALTDTVENAEAYLEYEMGFSRIMGSKK